MKLIEVPVRMKSVENAELEDMGLEMSGDYFDSKMILNIDTIDHFYSSGPGFVEVWQNGCSVEVQMEYKYFKELILNAIQENNK